MLSRFISRLSNNGFKNIVSMHNLIRYSSHVEFWFMSEGLFMFIQDVNTDFDARVFNFVTYTLGLQRNNTDSPCDLGCTNKYRGNRECVHQFRNFSLRTEFNRRNIKYLFHKVQL